MANIFTDYCLLLLVATPQVGQMEPHLKSCFQYSLNLHLARENSRPVLMAPICLLDLWPTFDLLDSGIGLGTNGKMDLLSDIATPALCSEIYKEIERFFAG